MTDERTTPKTDRPDTDQPDSDKPDALAFETDRGAARSTWIAVAILLAISAWMVSGLLWPTGDDDGAGTSFADTPQPVAVSVRKSVAEPVTLYFQAEGQTQPDRESILRTEVTGDVAEVLAKKGDMVTGGQTIARLTTERATAELRRARQEQDRAQREFDNASALLEQGVATVDRVAQARTTLTAADAQVTAAQQTVEDAVITAPFAGRLESLSLDPGEFFAAATEVGRIVDISPLSVVIRVPQQSLAQIDTGQTAQVSFITGQTREGIVGFVGRAAAAETRTFLAEIEVPNSDGAIPSGISAEIRIATGQLRAHFVQPSVISLRPDGTLGVKSVADGRVVFHEIDVVRAQVDGLWVTGLPDRVDLIIIGQGYVREGETVRTVSDTGSDPGSDMGTDTGTDTGTMTGTDAATTRSATPEVRE